MDNKIPKCGECGKELKRCLKCGQEFKNSEPDQRGRISLWFLEGFIILSLLLFLIQCNWGTVFYESVDYKSMWKMIGRILFCFDFFLLGITGRAFAYHRATKRGVIYAESYPWKSYLFEYVPIGIVASVFIFSVVTAIAPLSSTYVFYFLSGSAGIVAGYRGYAFLDSMKVG